MNDNNLYELQILNLLVKSMSLICTAVGLICLLADMINNNITLLRFVSWIAGSTVSLFVFFYINETEWVDDEWQ